MSSSLLSEPILYSAEDQEIWSILFSRQQAAIGKHAYSHFAKGLDELSFSASRIPLFETTNARLRPLTGWEIYAVPGLIDNQFFFQQMAGKRFGATTWIRKKEQLDYLEEPDIFHDVYGHVPLLTDPLIAAFLLRLAAIADHYPDSEEIIEIIARIYWYTIEFGLVKENDQPKIYGAGILSSVGETIFSMSPSANHQPFLLENVIKTPYIKDKFQEQYFILENLSQLFDIAMNLDKWLGDKYRDPITASPGYPHSR